MSINLRRLFKQAITYVVLASLQLGTLVQTKEAYAQYVPPVYVAPVYIPPVYVPPVYTPPAYVPPASAAVSAATSGYTADGTLFMGGQRIGNPHQVLHDAQIPAFMTITATRYTYSNINDPLAPNYGQGTLAQMETATTVGSDASVLLNRLYLTPTNPYPVVPLGTHNNYQTYQGVLTNAQAANYLLTNADDGKTYAFKTLTAASRQAADLLIRELPNTSQFQAAADPLGGGVGVRVTQNGDAAALAAYMATVKPYDYSWQPNFGMGMGNTGNAGNTGNTNNTGSYSRGHYISAGMDGDGQGNFNQGGFNQGGFTPGNFSGWANSNNYAPSFGEGDGPQLTGEAGRLAMIRQLQDSAVAGDKRVRSQTSANSLDLSGVNPNSLFGEGYNLFEYGSNSNPNRDLENDFLRRLQAGQLTAGSADYLEASRIAQERYRIAYATRLETNKPLQYSVADAQRKANELQLSGINANELFGQGFDLFKYNPALRANGEAENVLLARLQSGQLQAGSSEYQQAAEIAQQRLRDAYAQSLSPPPPKKVAKWKLIAGAVVGAVLTFVTAGALLPYVAGALTSATVAATTAALATVSATVTTAAALATVGISASMTAVLTAVAGIAAGAVGALASTTITTGSLSQGLKAAGNTLVSGSVSAIVSAAIGVGFDFAGLSGLGGTAGTISNIAQSTLSGAVSQTILGGGSFADNLQSAAINSVVNAASASAANAIGANSSTLGVVGTEIAHGVLGCATGMVRAGSGDGCVPGAAGAVAGHLAAPVIFGTGFDPTNTGTVQGIRDTASFFSGVVGGAVAAAVGDTDQVNQNYGIGSAAGSNAAANNALGARGNKLPQELRACNNSSNPNSCFASIVSEMSNSEAEFNGRLADACSGANANHATCNMLMSNANLAADSIYQATMTANTPEQQQYLRELAQRQAASIAQYQNNLNALAGGASAADLTIATAVGLGPAAVAGVAGNRGAKPAGSGAVQSKPSVATPISAPNNFETRNVNGTRIYVNNDTGMVMVPNPANHGGQSYNVWPSVSSYNKNPNNRADSVWADTGISRGR